MKFLINYLSKKILGLAFGIALVFQLSACEDVIEVDLPNARPQLQVEAWLYSDTSVQLIKLRRTTPYFDTQQQPPVTDAQVVVVNELTNVRFPFTHIGNGDYTISGLKPQAGDRFRLEIQEASGEQFIAQTQVGRVPDIDSLQFTFTEGGLFNPEDRWELRLWARDPSGTGDFYKFDAFLRGQIIETTDPINITSDVSADGLIFIPPINFGLNQIDYKLGDTVSVRIISLTQDAFDFFNEVETQINNGGLFAQPVVNVRTNIRNASPNAAAEAVGYFGASSVAWKTRVVGEPQLSWSRFDRKP